MKKITLISYFLVQCFVLFAQNEQQKEADVRAMEVVEAQALLQKDIPTLQKVWASNFMVNAPINMVFIGGQIDLVRAGILSYRAFTRNIEHVMVLKDVVITMGSETVVPSGLDPKAGQTIHRRYTNIWSKEKGIWILVARHANDICSASIDLSSSQKLDELAVNFMNVKVRNNPTRHQFEIQFESPRQNVIIGITDNNGRLIERRTIPAGTSIIKIGGNYRRGTYFAHFNDGLNSKTVTLIKL
jgi:hypothetical protein